MLYLVCSSGLVHVLKCLLGRKGPPVLDLNFKNSSGLSPLHLASAHNQPYIIDMLLSVCPAADVNIADSWGQTSLMKASARGHLSAAKALIDSSSSSHLIDVNAEDDLGISALGLAVSLTEQHPDLVALLLDHGATITSGGGEGEPVLHRACALGREWSASLLLSLYKGLLESRAGDGATPLHRACQFGHTSVARMILAATMAEGDGFKAVLEAVDDGSRSALHFACSSQSADTVDLVLGCIDDSGLHHLINARDESGRTPLHHLLHSNRKKRVNGILQCIELLLSDDAVDVTIPDAYGATPLMLADGWQEVCELIKMAGG